MKKRFSKLLFILIIMTLFLSSFPVFAQEISDLTLPDTPADISLHQIQRNNFDVEWNCDLESQFEVYLKQGSGEFKLYDTVFENRCSLNSLDLKETYFVKVRSFKKSGDNIRYSKFSSTLEFVPFSLYISELEVVKSDTKKISLNWSEVENADGYIVYRSLKDNEGFEKIADLESLAYEDSDIKEDTKYYYRVNAYMGAGESIIESGDSNVVLACLLDMAPDAPKANAAFGKIVLNWKASPGKTFELLRADKYDGEFKKIANTDNNWYYDEEVEEGKVYYYKLRTIKEIEEESFYSMRSTAAECASIKLDRNKPVIAFSFDDGPGTQSTERILDVLQEYNCRATFFTVGRMIKKGQASKNLIRERNLGCELANHSYNHYNLTKLPDKDVIEQVEKTSNVVKDVTGVTPKLVRPPYGSNNKKVLSLIDAPAVLWNIDTLDWKTHDPKKIYDEVIGKIRDGDIVLMHDVHDDTADAVETIVPELVKQGYQIVTVSELALYKGVELENGGVYYNFR